MEKEESSASGPWIQNRRKIKMIETAALKPVEKDHLTAPLKRGNYYVITGGGDGMSAVKVKIVQIGNSRGIRIPKALLEQCGLEGELELVPDGDKLILRPSARPRRGWAKAFQEMAERGDDALLIGDIENDFDDNEWEWK
jgi:antitoxin MazE